jgi:hypothetical protein
MSVPDLSTLFTVTSIMGTVSNPQNNNISATTGDAVSGEVSGPSTQMWQHVGFASKPAFPQPGIASAQSLNLVRANGDISIASKDLRDNDIYGNLGPGETCLYARGPLNEGMARVSLKADGSVTLSTTTEPVGGIAGMSNSDSGVGVYLRIDPDRLSFIAPWGKLIFDKSGFHVQTQTGASIDLSNISIPLGGVNMCRINASSVIIDSPTISLGPSPTNGGIGYMNAVYGLIPPPAPSIPILGVGVGAITIAASSSTKVLIGI